MIEKVKKLFWRMIKKVRRLSDRTVEYWNQAAKYDPYGTICTDWDKEKFDTTRESIVLSSNVKLNKDMVVLDLCCRLGRVANFIAFNVKKYIGVDFSRNMVKKARKRHSGLANVEFIVNDGWTLKEIGNNLIDLVFCELAFQHMEKDNVSSYVKEVFRVLVKDGVFLAQVPRFDFYKDVYAFKKEEIDELFADFRKVEYLSYERKYAYYLVKATK